MRFWNSNLSGLSAAVTQSGGPCRKPATARAAARAAAAGEPVGKRMPLLLVAWQLLVGTAAAAGEPMASAAGGAAALETALSVLATTLSALALSTAVLLVGVCVVQLIPSRCFNASRRRAAPDHAAVPKTPSFSVEWLSAALLRSGTLPAGGTVSGLQHAEVAIAVDDADDDVINGGGLAGGRTVRITGITYTYNGAAADAAAAGLPTSIIQKLCDDQDVVGGSDAHPNSLRGRIVIDYIVGLRSAKDLAMVLEIKFYEELAPDVVKATGLRLPTVYYSAIDGAADTSCLLYTCRRDATYCRATMLMEDLGVSGFVECGHVVLGWKDAIPLPVVEAALTAMARLHAWGWGGRPSALSCKNGVWSQAQIMPRTNWTPLLVGCSSAQQTFVIKQWGATTTTSDTSTSGRTTRSGSGCSSRTSSRCCSICGRRWVGGSRRRRHWTEAVIHGDYHRGNLF